VREITRCSSSLDGHASPILCASFSPTGQYLATGSGDNTCRLWNLNSETPSATLSGHSNWVLCVEWDGLERWVATGSMDNSVRLWDPKTGKADGEGMKGHTKWITSLSWEPIHLYALRSLCIIVSFSIVLMRRNAYRNPSNPRLASSSKDSTVRVWHAKSRKLDFTLGGHSASVNQVRWGGEGVIFTASSDRTVKLWDGKDVRLLLHSLSSHEKQ